uniref:Pentatricopeptide repeat superfamily protein n=1 Tax=Kalanchoe fedtschenkoi TaxID=63787 RepID=A0A7N0UQ09_KALFE
MTTIAATGLLPSALFLNYSSAADWFCVDSAAAQAQRRIPSCSFFPTFPLNIFPRISIHSYTRRHTHNSRSITVRATAELDGDASAYHPSEGIGQSAMADTDARLTAAETSRTIIQVNSKATIMFSGIVDDGVHHNIFWPDVPYVTDEHGNIYFQVSNDENMMQSLTTDDNVVQVIIGFDTVEMLKEMEESGSTEIELELEDIEDDDSEFDEDGSSDDDDEDEDYEKEWTAVLDDEDDEDSDESLGDWAKLDTMNSTHPMYFAKKMAEVTSDDQVDWKDQPPAGLVIQGLVRPALTDEQSIIQKRISEQIQNMEMDRPDKTRINGHDIGEGSEPMIDNGVREDEIEKGQSSPNGNSFYRLELVRIQLMSAHGQQADVDLEDFREASPDAIAHSADKIMSRLKEGGEKTAQALKSLCWRIKGIQVEEAILKSIDSLGFDLRVCSGRQVQTLRFGFITRAPSEYSAERQLNDLLFPPTSKLSKKRQSRP